MNEMYLHQSMAASERHHHHHPHHLHHDDMLGSSSSLSLTTTTPAVTNQARTLHQQRHSPVFLSSTTPNSSNNIPLKKDRTYSPKTSPARNLGPGLGLGLQYESMDTYLAQLEQSINLRHIAAEAERVSAPGNINSGKRNNIIITILYRTMKN